MRKTERLPLIEGFILLIFFHPKVLARNLYCLWSWSFHLSLCFFLSFFLSFFSLSVSAELGSNDGTSRGSTTTAKSRHFLGAIQLKNDMQKIKKLQKLKWHFFILSFSLFLFFFFFFFFPSSFRSYLVDWSFYIRPQRNFAQFDWLNNNVYTPIRLSSSSSKLNENF